MAAAGGLQIIDFDSEMHALPSGKEVGFSTQRGMMQSLNRPSAAVALPRTCQFGANTANQYGFPPEGRLFLLLVALQTLISISNRAMVLNWDIQHDRGSFASWWVFTQYTVLDLGALFFALRGTLCANIFDNNHYAVVSILRFVHVCFDVAFPSGICGNGSFDGLTPICIADTTILAAIQFGAWACCYFMRRQSKWLFYKLLQLGELMVKHNILSADQINVGLFLGGQSGGEGGTGTLTQDEHEGWWRVKWEVGA